MNKPEKHYYLFFCLADFVLCVGNIAFAYTCRSIFNTIAAVLLGTAFFINLYGFFTTE